MVNYTSGLICVGIPTQRATELKLPQMVVQNTESHGTAFTVSVDYKVCTLIKFARKLIAADFAQHGTSTGISAHDRAATIRALADSKASESDFNRPGHMFPLRARDGGVLVRPGHTVRAFARLRSRAICSICVLLR